MNAETNSGMIRIFDPNRVKPFPEQPRKRFRGICALAKSIQRIGQVMPCIVTLLKDDPEFDAMLIDGERRLRACQHAGVPVRCEIREDCTTSERFTMAVAANFCDQKHDCVETACSIRDLLAGRNSAEAFLEVSEIFGKSVSWLKQHLFILRLSPGVQEMLQTPADPADGSKPKRGRKQKSKLTFSLGLLLASLPKNEQLVAARHIVSKGLSVTAARRYLAHLETSTGQRVGMRAIGPREKFNRLAGQVKTCQDAFGTFLDLPEEEFCRAVTSVGLFESGELLENLEECAQGLSQLAQAIRRATAGDNKPRLAAATA